MSMVNLSSLLGGAQQLNNLNIAKSYQKKENSLYQQRMESGAYEKMAELSPELATMQQHVDRLQEETGSVIDKILSPEPSMDSIMAKMNAGQELSPAELEHLKKTDPEIYSKAVQITAERKAHKERMKNCKTKEDVQRAKLASLSSVMTRVNDISNNPNIPEDKKLAMIQHEGRRAQAINEETAEYMRSAEYANKPTEAERSAENKAERLEREESARPQKPESEERLPEPTNEDEISEADSSGTEAAPEQPLPGEGKSIGIQPEALEGEFKPRMAAATLPEAHDAYSRMMKARDS